MKKLLASFLFLPLAVFAADTNALPALAPAYGEMPPPFFEQHKNAIFIGGFALLLLAALILWQLLKPKPKIVLPPEIVAREILEKQQRQPEDGKVLSEISQTLRRYISTALEFPNGELTTAEFSAALAGNKKINAELAQTISDFLRECDERKFSPAKFSAQINAAQRALEIVAQVENETHRQDACATTQ